MQRVKWAVIVVCVFLCVTSFVIHRRYDALVHHSAMPTRVNFCDLAKNRKKFWDTQFTTSALVGHSLEGSGLISPACPEVFLRYRLENAKTSDRAAAQSISDPFSPDIWISFDGDLTMGSQSADDTHRLLRACGISTGDVGVVRVLKIVVVTPYSGGKVEQ